MYPYGGKQQPVDSQLPWKTLDCTPVDGTTKHASAISGPEQLICRVPTAKNTEHKLLHLKCLSKGTAKEIRL